MSQIEEHFSNNNKYSTLNSKLTKNIEKVDNNIMLLDGYKQLIMDNNRLLKRMNELLSDRIWGYMDIINPIILRINYILTGYIIGNIILEYNTRTK